MARKRREEAHKRVTRGALEYLVSEATVDCYNESEQVTGFYTMIDDAVAVPFETQILGATAVVERVELTDRDEIVAVCRQGRERQRISLFDLPPPARQPEGWEWIEAYRHWAQAGGARG